MGGRIDGLGDYINIKLDGWMDGWVGKTWSIEYWV